jgi:dipeptidyl aminopeptidase/acylaminoacyl peptidase
MGVSRTRATRVAVGLVILGTASTALSAQRPASSTQTNTVDPITHEGYIEPPEPLKSLIDAPRHLNVSYSAGSLNPGSRRYLLRTVGDNMPSLAAMGSPYYNLAGWKIDSRANRSRTMTTNAFSAMELLDWSTGRTVKVQIPAGAKAYAPTWSPDGNSLAFFATFDNATHIYVADAATGQSRQVTRNSALATNVTALYWTADSRSLITVLAPDNRPAEPKQPAIATEPIVRINENNTLRTRTMFDLLKSPYEKDLLEYHMTGQLAVIDVRSRNVKKISAPGMIRSINAAPDASYFRIVYLDRPFSYFQQLNSWGTHELLLDANGSTIRELARRELRDGTQDDPDDPNDDRGPQGGPQRPTGPQGPDLSRRAMQWHPYEGGQVFLQAARNPQDSTRLIDRFVHLANPADTTATRVIYETTNRISAVRFSDNGRILFITEAPPAPARGGNNQQGAQQGGNNPQGGNQQGGNNQQTPTATEIAVFLDEGGQKYTIASGRILPQPARSCTPGGGQGAPGGGGGGGGGQGGGQGAAAAAGSIGAAGGNFVSRSGSRGNNVVVTSSDGAVFVQGTACMQSDSTQSRPIVEKINIKTGARSRVYTSNSPLRETIITPLDDDFSKVLVRREPTNAPAQQYVLDVRANDARQITDNKDHFANLQNLQRRTLIARRGDGLPIRVRVTLPANFKDGDKLPALFWFYPSEYDSAQAYTRTLNQENNQQTPQPSYQNFGVRSMALITQVGYALVEPDAPIVGGDGLRPNDNYVRDLREGLHAVVTMLDTLGIVDRNRLAIGGHSYGGFSTVNAMVHTTLFKAGIAGDGAYNRTLTPNGFQRESRTLWQGRDTYLDMSPFLYANQLSGALLLYHSTEDENVGTHPINSERLFHALQGLGKTVSLYMYPYEDHGPRARETVMDQWGRWVAWLDKYVKNHGRDTKVIMQN